MDFASLSAGDRIRIMLELIGGPQYAAQMQAAAAQTTRLGGATARAGAAAKLASQRTWLYNQAVFTMRRYAFYATLAVTSLAAVALKAGYQFNAQMETGRLLFTQFLGSAKAADTALAALYKQAIYSPFIFKDLVNASTVMMTLGVSASDTQKTVTSLVDALAPFENRAQRLQRAAYALGHMATMGRLTGLVLSQLGRDSIPMFAALQKELGYSADQLHRVAQLGIPASVALAALNKYVKESPIYANLAYKIATRTLPGLIATFKDFASQMLGILTRPLYDAFRNWLFIIVKPGGLLESMQKASKVGGVTAALAKLDGYLGAHGTLVAGLTHFGQIIKNVWQIFSQAFVPAFLIGMVIFSHIIPVLKILSFLTGILAHHTTILKYVLIPLATIWIATHSVMFATALTTKFLKIMTFGLIGAEGRLLSLQKLKFYWARRNYIMLLFNVKALKSLLLATRLVRDAETGMIAREMVLQGKWAKFGRRLIILPYLIRTKYIPAVIAAATATWAWTVALLANPITWIILGVVALTAGLVVLYFKWKAFHDAVNNTVQWIKTHWQIADMLIAPFLPLLNTINVIYALITALKQLWSLLKSIPTAFGGGGKGGNFWGKLGNILTPWWVKALPFAAGGVMPYSGWAMVGERGPELLHLRAGTTIMPVNQVTSIGRIPSPEPMGSIMQPTPVAGNDRPIIVQVMLDRKIVGEGNSRARADTEARR